MSNDDAAENDDHVDIDLRPVGQVAARGITIASLIGLIARAEDQDDQATQTFDLREWLRTEGLWEQCTDGEKALLTPPNPGLHNPDAIELDSLAEHLTTLGWALSLADPFAEASGFSLANLIRGFPAPWDKTAAWIDARNLRPEALVAIERERAEVWYWRLEIEAYRRVAQGQDLQEIERAIDEVTQDGVAAGLLTTGDRGGFTIDGVPLSNIDPSAIDSLESTMRERLRTLIWVCGHGTSWDDVPLEI